ncbi:alpha/beta fold hydrolase [Aldersonia kunmingensis]|uniref:alpha/beta fold hydrolase n=1 Tax=Aldersonia kunmingensis TaxID=408066 RepID=UPI0024803607|nr:alpha/beta hydrolase [Aldersonia kunmingensis]
MRRARARLAGRSRVVTTTRGPVELGECGTGPPVLVVHGMSGGFDMGLSIGTDILGDKFRIIAPSRFGYLRSPLPSGATHATQADTLAALLDSLDVPSAVVIGVSAGAQSATQLALRHPQRVNALILITPALFMPPEPGANQAGPPAFVLDRVLGSDFLMWAMVRFARGLVLRIAGVPAALHDQITPEFRHKVVDWFLPASARHVGLAHDMRTTIPVAPDLPIEQLTAPALLVSAADDPYKTAEIIRYSGTRLPTARVVVCDSGGHVLLGQDDRVRREVRQFLDVVL